MAVGGNSLTIAVVLTLLDQMSDKVKAAVDQSRGHLDKFSEHAKQVGASLSQFGRQVGLAGAAMGAGVGLSVKAFAELEDSAALLKATMTGSNGLSENFEAVNDLAIRLGNELPGTTRDFYQMIDQLLRLGVTERDVIGGVGEAAAKLSVVMKISYAESAELAAKLKNAMGVANEDMLAFMDTIQRTGNEGVRASEMMLAFARSSGGLKQFGVQGEEASRAVANLYAQLIKAGMSGETVGTNFNALLNTLAKFDFKQFGGRQDDVDAITERMRALGIELDFFDDKTKQFKGVEHMVREFDKLRVLDQEQSTKFLQTLFGGGTDQQIAALLTQSGVAGFEALRTRIESQADLQTRAAVQLDTLASRWEAATGNFTNLLAAFGEQVAPVFKELVGWFGDVSGRLAEWVNNNQELAKAIGVTLTAVAGALTAIGAAGLAAGAIATTFGAVASGLSVLAAAAATAGPALIALAANPIVLAILGLGAVAYAGWKWGPELVRDAQKVLTDLANTVKAKIDQAKKAITDTAAAWKAAGEAIIQGLLDGIKAKATAVVERVKEMGNNVVDTIKDLLKIRSPSQVMYQVGVDTAQGYALGLAAGIPQVQQTAQQLTEVVAVSPADQPRNADGSFKSREDAQRQGTGVLGGMREYLDGIRSAADQTKDMVVRAFRGAEDALVSFVRKGKLDFSSLVDSMLNDLIRLGLQQFTQAAAGGLANVLGGLFGGGATPTFTGFATGGAFSNRIIARPTAFPLGLMGEAGPEAIMPLTRAPDGSLGVRSGGGGGAQVTVNVIEDGARGGEVQRRDEGGTQVLDVFVDRIRGAIAEDIMRGQGAVPASMERAYGLNRGAGSY